MEQFIKDIKLREKNFEYNISFWDDIKYRCKRPCYGCYESGPIPDGKKPITFHGFWYRTHITDEIIKELYILHSKKEFNMDRIGEIEEIYAEQDNFMDNPEDWNIEVIECIKGRRLYSFKKKYQKEIDASDENLYDDVYRSELPETIPLFQDMNPKDYIEKEMSLKRDISKDIDDLKLKIKKFKLDNYVLPKQNQDWYKHAHERECMTQDAKILLLFKKNFTIMKNPDASA